MTDENKTLPKSISSIENCLAIIGDLRGKPENSQKIFYRGHGQIGWDLVPSLFRGAFDSSQEKRILQEMTSRKSLDFSVDQNMFERLVRAQHYGLPTRLLDVTLSPLVALFFACSSDEEKTQDGELITITSEKSKIKYYDSHTVSCLAHLASLPEEEKKTAQFIKNTFDPFKKSIYAICDKIISEGTGSKSSTLKLEELQDIKRNMQSMHVELILLYISRLNEFRTFIKGRDKITDPLLLQKLLNNIYEAYQYCNAPTKITGTNGIEYINKKIINAPNDILQESKLRKLLSSSIAEERPGFQNFIELEDLFKTLLVYPKQNNERIIAQQGAFLLFGLNEKLKREEEENFGIQRYKIPQKAKTKILEQLDWLGINESFIYPELEKLSGHLLKEMKREKEGYPH